MMLFYSNLYRTTLQGRSIKYLRVTARCDHDLVEIRVIALCAVMVRGAEGWDDVEAWGEENKERLRLYLELRNGIPDDDTIRRVLRPLPASRPHLTSSAARNLGYRIPALLAA